MESILQYVENVSNQELKSAVTGFLYSRVAAARREATLEWYGNTLRRYLLFTEEKGHTWPPTAAQLRDFLASKRMAGLKPVTIRGYWEALRGFLHWCAEEGLLGDIPNPMAHVAKPTLPKDLPRAVPQPKLDRLFKTLACAASQGDRLDIRDYALYRTIYDTGCRVSEATHLLLSDLDLEEQSIIIRVTKTNQRKVFFGRLCALALAAYLAVRPTNTKFLFVSRRVSEPLPLWRGNVGTNLHAWCDAAGIDRIRVHDLRHSCATHSLRLGVDINHVQRQLGHSALSQTARYLSYDDPARQAAFWAHAPGDHLHPVREDP